MPFAPGANVNYLRSRKRRRRGGVDLHRSIALTRGDVVADAFTADDLVRPITFQARVEAGNAQFVLTIGTAVVVTFAAGNLVLAVTGNSSVATPFALGRIGDIAVGLRPGDDRYAIWVNSRRVAAGALSSGFAGGNFAAETDDLTAGPGLRSQLHVYKGAVPRGFT